jgi:hypothetical protein
MFVFALDAPIVSELMVIVSVVGPSDSRSPAGSGDVPPQAPKDSNVLLLDPPVSGQAEVPQP